MTGLPRENDRLAHEDGMSNGIETTTTSKKTEVEHDLTYLGPLKFRLFLQKRTELILILIRES